jgi:uncharacterized membrane-anchored protein
MSAGTATAGEFKAGHGILDDTGGWVSRWLLVNVIGLGALVVTLAIGLRALFHWHVTPGINLVVVQITAKADFVGCITALLVAALAVMIVYAFYRFARLASENIDVGPEDIAAEVLDLFLRYATVVVMLLIVHWLGT